MSDGFSQRLCTASEEGDYLTIIKLLRRIPNVDVNVQSVQYGWTALSLAARGGYAETVKVLLDAGADANLQDAVYVTPLHLAAQGNHVEVIRLLLLHSANPHAKTKNGMTPMDLTVYGSDSWKVLYRATVRGSRPRQMTENIDVVPVIPRHCIPKPLPVDPDAGKKKKKTNEKEPKKKKKKR